ncbi:hypothetical protein [Endozoicomonas sp. ONNA2]|uniref:hypothetical protein n=1 Tax=Endozoicomonas sp. ONNA2 TaxID=2828741 RepID=UPI0021485358|nr:hypothetical protein [Endozoicomonas sp. ONNA2]
MKPPTMSLPYSLGTALQPINASPAAVAAGATCASGPFFGSSSMRIVNNGDNVKESLSRSGRVSEKRIDSGKVYTVAGLTKLGDRSIDIYVTQSGKVQQSSPGNSLVHYGTGDEVKELKPGEDRIERSEADQEYYFLSKGQSKKLDRGKVYEGTNSTPDCYVSPQGQLTKARADGKLFKIGAAGELVEYKPDPKGYQHVISQKKEHFIVTATGAFPLKPGIVNPATGNRPAMYLSESGQLTAASDTHARLFKLGDEDQVAEFKSGEAAFKYTVSEQKTPFLITSTGAYTLKPGTLYKAQDGRPEMYVSKECVLTKASDTTSRLVKLGDEDEAVEYEPNSSNFNIKISQKGNPYCITSTGASHIKPGSVYMAQGTRPAFYLSGSSELTTASSQDATLIKLGQEDQAVEYQKDPKGFNYVVSKQRSPFLVTAEGFLPLTYDQTVIAELPAGRQLEVTAKRDVGLQHRFID